MRVFAEEATLFLLNIVNHTNYSLTMHTFTRLTLGVFFIYSNL